MVEGRWDTEEEGKEGGAGSIGPAKLTTPSRPIGNSYSIGPTSIHSFHSLGSIGPPSPSPPLLPQVRRGSPSHGGDPAGGEEIADPLPLPLVRSQLIPRSQPPRVGDTSCRTSAVPRRSRTAMTTPMTIPREPKTRRETARLISLMGGRFWSTLGDSILMSSSEMEKAWLTYAMGGGREHREKTRKETEAAEQAAFILLFFFCCCFRTSFELERGEGARDCPGTR